MARPFPTTFEKDALDDQPSGASPISYQANVNRQKTRKWVDAKAANYGGDDWGDDDDEYEYDEPPPPVSKPTGLRQQGNTLQSPPQSGVPSADAYKKSYGDLPARPRVNSFDEDDERRNFSSSTVIASPQTDSRGPPTRFSQMTGLPNDRQASGPPLSVSTQEVPQLHAPGLRQTNQVLYPVAGSPQSAFQNDKLSTGDPSPLPPTAPDAGFSPSGGRRDYSPAPPSVTTRSAGPEVAADSPSARFPARKSSLSLAMGPNLEDITRSPLEVPPTKVASPSTGPAKALPFIRPADIYRRAEEERRQSLESGARPSLDALTSPKPGDRSDSPGKQPLKERTSADTLSGNNRQMAEKDDSPGGRYLAPTLEPVKERKSEYGFDGFNVTDYASKDNAPELSQPLSDSAKLDVQEARRQSTSPKLPDLNRMSGFGVDMFLPKSDTDSHLEKASTGQKSTTEQNSVPAPPELTTAQSDSKGQLSDISKSVDEPEHSKENLHEKQSSATDHSMDDDEELAPPRTLNHAPSEQSFRPNLPGGWTSYATTARTETPGQEDSQTSVLRKEQVEPDEADDIAPTTVKHPSPQTESRAAITEFEVGATRTKGDEDRNILPLARDAMPTPDPSMAPSGNLYSTTALDPRLLPKLEQAPGEAQLRSDIVFRDASAESLDAPPPPPAKDTPVIGTTDTPGYFSSYKDSQSTLQHKSTPVLVQASASDIDENDRLEEEIVRRLSPQPRDGPPHDSGFLTTNPGNATRESTYLPAEYGDYWASSAEESQNATQRLSHYGGSHASPTESLHRTDSHNESIAPLSVAKSEPAVTEATVDRPPIKQRFSWEQSSENVLPSDDGRDKEVLPPPPALPTAALTTPSSLPGTQPIHEMVSSPQIEAPLPSQHNDEKIAVNSDGPSIGRGSPDGSTGSNNAAIIGGGAALAAGATVAAVAMNSPTNQPQRRASLAEEKATRVSSYPVNVTPPESEHPARSPEPYFAHGQDQIGHPPPPSSVSTINSPNAPPPPASSSRLLAFKEILNMKSSHERRQTFDDTRQRFAAMDSGLSNWMETLKAQHPEHTNATGFWAASGAAAGSGPKTTKTGLVAGLQQPYYQQYLNASSPTNPSTPTSAPGPSGSAAYQQQGFPAAGHSGTSKITTQQVQAKGKEFLHTAGVFGGKAGKAGKGLLAKGKSKFRGSGGDKTTPEPKTKEPKPKNEHRSSWSLPLSKPKPSGPLGKSNPPNKEDPATVHPLSEARQSTTLTSFSSQPPVIPPTDIGDTFGKPTSPRPHNSSSQVTPPNNTQSHQSSEPVASVREIRDADQSTTESSIREDVEDGDKLDDFMGPPRPIGKHQPSWDPFNATPIAEEQGSAYDTRTTQQSYPFPDAAPTEPDLKVPAVSDIQANHETSRGGDIKAHDVVDDRGINNDWVMVSPQAESTESVTKANVPPVSIMHRPRGSSYEIPVLPDPTKGATASKSLPPNEPHASQSSPSKFSFREQSPVVAQEQEVFQPDSSFLPPIRRTSAFGFKFGSRHAKQRFPIDDDDEDDNTRNLLANREAGSGTPPVAATTTSHTSPELKSGLDHVPLRHERRSLQRLRQEDSGYSTEPVHDLDNTHIPRFSGPPRPVLLVEPSKSRNSIDEQDPSRKPQPQRQSIETARPVLTQGYSSEQSQRSTSSIRGVGVQTPGSQPHNLSSPPGDFRTSQDAWKPNAVSTGVASPPPQNVPAPGFAPRQSWETQRPRGLSGSSYNFSPRSEAPPGDRQWASQQTRAFEQPPSSAQRYPGLFKNTPPNLDSYEKENGELPAHYYQQPITREAAFLPRQQTNEYQLPGVGPPDDDPRGSPRRNSSFFKDIGGKISRATSRERRKSVSQDDDFGSGRMRSNSHLNDDADSSIFSVEDKEKKKRRSSFFPGLNRASTGVSEAPKSRESMIAHAPGSRSDLFNNPAGSSPLVSHEPGAATEKKKSFFGSGNISEQGAKPNKLFRASTSSVPEATAGKKKRFSGLTGLFSGKPDSSRGSTPDRPQATRELSYYERQPLESPHFSRLSSQTQGTQSASTPFQSQPHQPPPHLESSQIARQASSLTKPNQISSQLLSNEAASQGSRHVLSKLKAGKPQLAPQDVERGHSQSDARPGKTSKDRRTSAGGLFGGLRGRKPSHQDEDVVEVQSQSSQQAQRIPPARTYSDLNDRQVQTQLQDTNFQDHSMTQRGRQVSREPQYDNVPIPGGYSLVRAQGAQSVATDYDPRGFRYQQQLTQYGQEYSNQGPSQIQPQLRKTYSQTVHQDPKTTPQTALDMHDLAPNQGRPYNPTLEYYQSNVNRNNTKRLSQEEIIARSPALPVEGQQRPYQISLPEDDEYRALQQHRSPTSSHSNMTQPQFSNVLVKQQGEHGPFQQQLGSQKSPQGPQIRRPSSPASYPLPEDIVFSPINPAADDMPPPPPPKDTAQARNLAPDHSRQVSGSSYLTTFGLNRSGTHRTAVSAISGFSDPPNQNYRTISPNRGGISGAIRAVPSDPDIAVGGQHISSTSPTPPSPIDTPRLGSPDLGPHQSRGENVKTTVLDAPRRPSLDLYDASPLGRPAPYGHRNQASSPSTLKLTIQTSSQPTPKFFQPQDQAIEPEARTTTSSQEQSKKLAELEGTRADGFNMRIPSQPQEEKIFYDAESGMRGYGSGHGDDQAVLMSATSYPGQEWNPYGVGGWEDDDDDVARVNR